MGMSGFGGASFYQTPPITTTIDRITSGIDPTQLSQNNTAKSRSRNGYLGYEISYEVDSLNLISAQFNLNGNRSQGSDNQQSILQDANTIQQSYRLSSNSRGRGNGMDAALNYQLGFKADKNRLLTLSYRYFNSGSNQTNQLAITDRMNYGLPDYRQLNDQNFSEQTIQLDYVYPVRKVTIEAGIKGIRRKNDSDFQYRSYNVETGRFDLNAQLSNQFSNTQDVYGIYSSAQYNLKTWTIKGGLRLEQTVMSADFISTESTVSQNYFNVVPSVAISKKFKNNSGLNLGYSQRIQRPGINQLNPFVDRSNPAFERAGNPNLGPQTGGDVQLGYNFSKKVSVNAGLAYGIRNHMIFPVSVYDSTTEITRTHLPKRGPGRLPQVNLSIAYPITKKWNASVNVWAAFAIAEGWSIRCGSEIPDSSTMHPFPAGTGLRKAGGSMPT
jgi:ferric enterobactin receptor